MDINSGEPAPSTSSERKRKYPAGMESPSADPQPTNCLQADFSEDYVISMGTLNQINEINMQNNPLHNTYNIDYDSFDIGGIGGESNNMYGDIYSIFDDGGPIGEMRQSPETDNVTGNDNSNARLKSNNGVHPVPNPTGNSIGKEQDLFLQQKNQQVMQQQQMMQQQQYFQQQQFEPQQPQQPQQPPPKRKGKRGSSKKKVPEDPNKPPHRNKGKKYKKRPLPDVVRVSKRISAQQKTAGNNTSTNNLADSFSVSTTVTSDIASALARNEQLLDSESMSSATNTTGARTTPEKDGSVRVAKNAKLDSLSSVLSATNKRGDSSVKSTATNNTRTTNRTTKSSSSNDIERRERNAKEKERSSKISLQIQTLRDLLSSSNAISPKSTKRSVLTEAATFIKKMNKEYQDLLVERQKLLTKVQMYSQESVAAQNAESSRESAEREKMEERLSSLNMPAAPDENTFLQPGNVGGQKGNEQQVLGESPSKIVFNYSTVPMAICTLGGTFVESNRRFAELTSIDSNTLSKLTLFQIVAKSDQEKAFQLISERLPNNSNNHNPQSTVPFFVRGEIHNFAFGLIVSLIRDSSGPKYFCISLGGLPTPPTSYQEPQTSSEKQEKDDASNQPKRVVG